MDERARQAEGPAPRGRAEPPHGGGDPEARGLAQGPAEREPRGNRAPEPPMSGTDSLTRLRAVTDILARRVPVILTATIALIDSVLQAADVGIAAERPTVSVAFTAEQVLEVARARGVPAFARAVGDRLILLASLGLDLAAPGIQTALVEMHRRQELRLARINDVDAVRADLAARGLRIELVDESAIVDGDMTFHAVVIA